jgi:flagellar biosynthesis protein FlhB
MAEQDQKTEEATPRRRAKMHDEAQVPLTAAAVAAPIAGTLQARVFSLSLIGFKLERLDPLKNLRQLMPSQQSMMELAKQVLKLMAIGLIGYRLIADALPPFAWLSAAVIRAVANGEPYVIGAPRCKAARALESLVNKLIHRSANPDVVC